MSDVDLNSPEVKAAIKAAIEESERGLLAKRDELLAEVKKLRKNSEISPDDYQRLKDENDKLSDGLAESQKQAKAALSDSEKIKKAYETESQYVHKLLIENGLTEALAVSGIKPEYTKAVKAMLVNQASIKVEGEDRKAMIAEKTVIDFVTEWSKSEEGKHFVSAPGNSGGGAGGGNGNGSGSKTMTQTDFNALPAKQRAEFMSQQGAQITD